MGKRLKNLEGKNLGEGVLGKRIFNITILGKETRRFRRVKILSTRLMRSITLTTVRLIA